VALRLGPSLTPPPEVAFDPRAPIVIIGAGRSGSTLLVRMLNSHPDVSFRGETQFMLARLWDTLWRVPDWYQFPEYAGPAPHSGDDCNRAEVDRKPAAARELVGSLFAGLMTGLLGIDPARRFWGYKEIWNGSGSWQVPWEAYDTAFPRATWVHLVRHPLDFLGSALTWNDWEVSLPVLQHALAEWVAIVRCSQGRAATGRYYEIRFEDLRASPRSALTPLFEGLGIAWDGACADVLTKKVGDSRRDAFAEEHLFPQLHRTPELLELAAAYGYSL
jgi:hypothetical protein